MSPRLAQFRADVEDGLLAWNLRVGQPYVRAYSAAFDAYKKALDDQKEADKARAELFVTAASIVTCSVLMAAVAQTSLRLLARDAALNVICRYNLERTFNAMAAAESSKTFSFAIGKVLDEAKKQIGKGIQDAVNQAIRDNDNVVATASPTTQASVIQSFLDNNKLCAHQIGKLIDEDPKLSEAQKAALFDKLRAAPILNPPKTKVNEQKLASKIELCLFMALVLDTDFLEDVPAQYFNQEPNPLAMAMNTRSRPIQVMPSDRNYPHPADPTYKSWGVPAHQSVTFTRLGDKIKAETDVAHRAVFGTPFFQSHWFLGGPNRSELEQDLRRAEQVIKRLAKETSPMSVGDLKL